MRVLIAASQPAVRSALIRVLNEESACQVVGEARQGGELAALARALLPDLILLDWELCSLSTLACLKGLASQPRLVVLSARPELRPAALAAGAHDFIDMADPPERLLAVLRAARQAGFRVAASPSLAGW